MYYVISHVGAECKDFTADLMLGRVLSNRRWIFRSPWQPHYPYHLISLAFEELGVSYKGFSLERLVIKTNREHSVFTDVSFSFYLPLCQHTHLHVHAHRSQHRQPCISPKFNRGSASVRAFFARLLFWKAKTHVLVSICQKWDSTG